MKTRPILGFILALLMGSVAFAEPEDTSALAQAKAGDLIGAVETCKLSCDFHTASGLEAVKELSIEVLRLGLRLADRHERNVVAGILGKRGDPAGLLVLEKALEARKPMLRRTAVDALGEMGTAGAVGLLRRLYYEDSEGQRLALSGLRRTRDRTALPLYLDAVRSTDTRVRTQGAGGLGELRSPLGTAVLLKLWREEKDPIVAVTLAWSLAAAGNSEGLAYLIHKARDGTEQLRDASVGLLGSLDDPDVVPVLKTALESDESEMVKTTAAASLTHFKDASGLELVKQAVEHVDIRIRLAAAISFTRMDYETARPLIINALYSPDPLVRSNAYLSIGQSVDTKAEDAVIAAVIGERDVYAKAQGLWTVGRIGGENSIAELLDLLDDEEEVVRHAAAEALILVSERLSEA